MDDIKFFTYFFIFIVLVICFTKLRDWFPKYEKIFEFISLFLIAIIVVLLSAYVGPRVFEGAFNYTVNEPNVVTPSEATNFTLTAFLAVAISYFLKDRS